MATFKKTSYRKSVTVFASVGALVGAGTIGCVGKVAAQQDNIATDLSTGKINLDAVKDALETSTDLSEFENRVNEIYEGDNLVLIKVEGMESQVIISGFEDVNQSNAIEENKDEKLFSITVDEEKYEVQGHSNNRYYYYGRDYWYDGGGYDYDDGDNYNYSDDDSNNFSNSDAKKMLFLHGLMHGPHKGKDRLMHQTNRERAGQMQLDRNRFRSSSAYTDQRNANKAFFAQQRARNPQAFNSRNQNISSKQSSYRQKQFSRIKASRSAGSSRGMRPGS